MVEWLKDCEICNAGLCKEMDKLMDKHRLSERTAARQLALTVKEGLGFPLYSGPQLRDRYRYHRGKKKPKNYSSKDHSQEELKALANGEVGEIPPKKADTKTEKENLKNEKTPERTPKESIFTEQFNQAFNKMLSAIKNAKGEKWKNTTQEAVLFHLKVLRDVTTIT